MKIKPYKFPKKKLTEKRLAEIEKLAKQDDHDAQTGTGLYSTDPVRKNKNTSVDHFNDS